MKLLATLEQKYPAATTATGLAGGFVSWLMQHLPAIERLFSLIGTIAGAAVAVLTLVMKWRAWRADARERERDRLQPKSWEQISRERARREETQTKRP